MKGNLGSVSIGVPDLVTSEHPPIFKTVPVKSGIEYPCGAVVAYDPTDKIFKPAELSENNFLIVTRPVADSEEFAFCVSHGVVNFDIVKKASYNESGESPVFDSWEELESGNIETIRINSMIL